MITVVTNHAGYAAKRNIYSVDGAAARIRRRRDPFVFLTHLGYRLTGRTSPRLQNLWIDFGGPELVHLRDGVSIGRSKWMVSFQDYLPRWGKASDRRIRRGLRRLAHSRCRALIAQSQAARDRQLVYTAMHDAPSVDAIERKLSVVHPPQALQLQSIHEKRDLGEKIVFAFVGHLFFLKGGAEVLRVFDRLLQQQAPVELVVVSRLEYGDWASRTTRDDLTQAMRIIERSKGRITLHDTLPNEGVLDLLKTVDVGLLPSWAETYGYSVLEAQSAGCPVITTDINAFPEINSRDVGWLIEVPHHEWKARAVIGSGEERRALSAQIEASLYKIITSLIEDPSIVRRKGSLALERIARCHDPARFAAEIESVYVDALR